jgi:hypothetical protein
VAAPCAPLHCVRGPVRSSIVAGRSTRSLEVTPSAVQISRSTAGFLTFSAIVVGACLFLAAFRARLDTIWPWVAAFGMITLGGAQLWASRIVERRLLGGPRPAAWTRRGLIATVVGGAILLAVGAIGAWIR